ncbi:PaaI family thioesterase [Sinimarinibacterium sp. CAU 1509]|uniref:PaaI family thioesterase n=1 Tax=Sinimarinibacterium sp. CAU 1509 TaxID=2562283 RepID=UPI0010AB7DD3|nr:PaaI family thioesterase [Sinimarinibacterium sp. CAU 1509]TJY59388.1 PaaI family thioesterase [Sinimarinibacterium sp. CAU 1509]
MPTLNPEYVTKLIDVVNTGDFPSHIDFKLRSIAEDHCTVSLEIARKHFQPLGIVHGGVIATLIDTATFWAGFMRLPEDSGLVNVDLKLNYLKAVAGGSLLAEGRCLRPGRQISYAETSVYNEKRELVAHGTSTLMALPGKGLQLGVAKFLD